MNEHEMLVHKLNRVCFLLGLATGTLIELSGDDGIPFDRIEGIKEVLDLLYKGTDEAIYK